MDARDLALVQGIDHTRTTLRRWNRKPARVLLRWGAASLLVAALLLVAVWLVAEAATPEAKKLLDEFVPIHFKNTKALLKDLSEKEKETLSQIASPPVYESAGQKLRFEWNT